MIFKVFSFGSTKEQYLTCGRPDVLANFLDLILKNVCIDRHQHHPYGSHVIGGSLSESGKGMLCSTNTALSWS